MSSFQQYDYIIAGAGCAGLSLVVHLIESGKFKDKQVLIIDTSEKRKNDRTWCFWEKEASLFQPIVYKEWKQLLFHAEGVSKNLDIEPYTYKLIRGIDFYTYCFEKISRENNIVFRQASITELVSTERETYIVADGEKIGARYIFNSVLFEKPALSNKQYWLLQHFKGVVVETTKDKFDPHIATLMDFRTNQSEGTTFLYVLPFNKRKALIEYTLFSKNLLKDEEYDKALNQYINNYFSGGYTITETEFGVIPMTNFPFSKGENNIIHIGTAGGQTKGSSGYTFKFIQKHSAQIVQALIEGVHPLHCKSASRRFAFYDSILLNILNGRKMPGDQIFSQLFQKNKAGLVLKFLDNETTIDEELKIISSLPTGVFLKAAINQYF